MNMPLHTSMFTYSLTRTCSYIHLNLHFNNMHTYLYIYIYIFICSRIYWHKLFCTFTHTQMYKNTCAKHKFTFMNIHDKLTHSCRHRNMITDIYSHSHLHTDMKIFTYADSEPAHKLTGTLINTVMYMHLINIHTYTYTHVLTQK